MRDVYICSVLRFPLLLALAGGLSIAGLAHPVVSPPPGGSAADVLLKIRKLRTTASLMHTTAHPDDEHGGVLAAASRGEGARVSLLSLTRGESGDNAIGPELFDALGLIRTEELLAAGRYYGLDALYFTTAVDYGFSKRLDEAVAKWGPEDVLRDMVAVIRAERPLVVVSRFQGNPRDGHGQHQAAGLLTRQAVEAAGDPKRFPEQVTSGLRPWRPLKLYMGGVREAEDWTVRIDTGRFDPVVGESYAVLGRLGLSIQRSQTGGRFTGEPGSSISFYKRLDSSVAAPDGEASFFDGIDVTIPGLYRALRREAPAHAGPLLERLDGELQAAEAAFRITTPSASAPALARALAAARHAVAQLSGEPDVLFMLRAKEEQIADALHAALGIRLTAAAQPPGTPEAAGPFAAGPPPLGPVVPGATFEVRTSFTNRSPLEVTGVQVSLRPTDPSASWRVADAPPPAAAPENSPLVGRLQVTVPQEARPSRPYFYRRSIQEARYTLADPRHAFLPHAPPPLEAVGRYVVGGVPVEIRRPVTVTESNLPYGHTTRALTVVPAVAVTLGPSHAVAPTGPASSPRVRFTTEVAGHGEGGTEGTVRLQVPSGWTVTPAAHPFSFARAGERALFTFEVTAPGLEGREYPVEAIATAGGREYREGYVAIRHRDLETRHLYRDATASLRGVDVRIASGLRVGYVMGVGDDVPSGLAQLGVDVQLLGAQDLATADLQAYDAIITGTRAYAVRDDLRTYNRRLLDYVRDGGNLIVLYNTQELVPADHAPYPGELPRTAEEVSEEDSPVEILAPDHPVFNTPNRITLADFSGWVEQRGSKFWSAWDPRYTPLLATWDTGQAPQKGGWLYARYGKGHYTYFAYAFHRQLPYGVPGAYRLLANLLSLE